MAWWENFRGSNRARRFSYQSYHVIGCDSVAEGAFFGVTDDGAQVYTRIPPFAIARAGGNVRFGRLIP